MRILVLGGTAWLGHRIAATFVERGHDVTCVARGSAIPAGARLVSADRDHDDALESVRREQWDAVVDVAGDPGHVRRAVRDLEHVTGRYVFVSTVNVYASHDVIGADEDAPILDPLAASAPLGPASYGQAKVACENSIVTTFGSDRVLIARSGLICGPGDPTGRTTYWPWRFAHPADRTGVLVPDSPGLPTSVIDVRDLADWLVTSTERGLVGVFNATGHPIPFPQHIAAAREAAGSDAIPVAADEQWLTEHGVSEWAGDRSMPLWLRDRAWYGFGARSNARAIAAGLDLRPLVASLRDGAAAREISPPDARVAGLSDNDERALLADWTKGA